MTEGTLVQIEGKPRTANEIKAQVRLIQEVMQSVMKSDVHYGVIPGTPKPSLWKPGAEKLAATFGLAIDPEVMDLSNGDEIHYRVRAKIMSGDRFIGAGVGEASSNEMKWKWRVAVCEEEWNETPEDRRRNFWKKGKDGPFRILQVRTEPADIANTVLKIAKKRALIDGVLTCTAASDIFAQDLEDLQENGIDPADRPGDANENAPPPVVQPQAKDAAPKPPPKSNGNPENFTGGVRSVASRQVNKKDGTTGTVYVITAANGIAYDTFSETFASNASDAKSNQGAVHIVAEKTQWGYKVKSLEPVLEG